MAIDKGGLDYTITARDAFSDTFASFRGDVRTSVADLQALRRELGKGSGAIRASRSAAKDVANATKARAQLDKEAERTEQIRQKFAGQRAAIEAKAQAAERQAVVKGQQQRRSFLLKARNQELVDERKAADKRKALLLKAQADINIINARAGAKVGTPIAVANIKAENAERLEGIRQANRLELADKRIAAQRERTAKSQRSLTKDFRAMTRDAQRAVPIFNGMFQAILVSEAIRGTINLVQGFIGELIRSNAEIESATLSLGALFTAVGDVRDFEGDLLKGPEALTASLALATDQVKQLRKEALLAPGAFEDILEAFQTAVAPGLTAGLNVDEIRRLSVRISQAAAAINLPQNQLAEEIRSLLSGTITPRNTRIATALGITNEDIRTAREAGTLARFLEERFEAFGVAADKATETFNLRLEKLRESFTLLAQEGGAEFFQRVSDAVSNLADSLITLNLDGSIGASPEALDAIKGVVDGLNESIDLLIGYFKELGATDLKATGELIGRGFVAATEVVLGIVEGIRTLVEVVVSLGKALSTVFGGDGSFRRIAELGTVLAGISALGGPMATLVGTLGRLAIQMGKLAIVSKTVSTVVGALTGLVARLRLLLAGVGAGAAGAGGLMLALAGPAVIAGIVALIGYMVALKKEIDDTEDATAELAGRMSGIVANTARLTAAKKGLSENQRELFELAGATEAAAEAARKASKEGPDSFARLLTLQANAAQQDVESLALLVRQFGYSETAAKRFAASLGDTRFEEFIQVLKGTKTGLDAFLKAVRQPIVTGPDTGLMDALKEGTEQAEKQVKELRRELKELANDLGFRADAKVLDQLETAREAEGNAVEKLVEGMKRLKEARAAADASPEASKAAFLAQKILETEKRREEIVKRIALLEAQAKGADTIEGVRELEHGIAVLNQALTNADAIAGGYREQLDGLFDGIADDKTREEITQVATDLVKARQSLAALEAGQGAATETATELDSQRSLVVTLGLELKARKELQALEEARIDSADQLALAQLDARIEAGKMNQTQRELLRAERQLTDLMQRRAALQRQIDEREDLGERQLEAIQGDSPEAASARAAIQQATKEQLEIYANEVAAIDLQLVNATNNIALLRSGLEAPISTGIVHALEEMNTGFDAFRTTIELTKSAVEELAASASSAIVDAFDPNVSVSIKERMGQLFKSIAQQLIQEMIRVAIVRAALGLSGLFGAGSVAAGAASGLSNGGPVAAGQGYASGGFIGHSYARPRGLHPTDTVPIWAAPGEYMMPRSAVSSLGMAFMDSVRAGAPDMSKIGMPSSRTVRPGRVGYATGGSIAQASAPATVPTNGGLQPVLIANDREFERLAADGRRGYRRVLQSNQRDVRAIASGA